MFLTGSLQFQQLLKGSLLIFGLRRDLFHSQRVAL